MESRFESEAPAVVTWLGVTYYLEPETAARALGDLAGVLAPSSQVALDYMLPLEDLPARYHELREQMASFLRSAGEPHINRYRAEELRRVVLAAGFAELRLERREDLLRRYWAPLDTDVELSARFGLAVAVR